MAEKSLTFARFDPLSEQFSILHKYEVAVSPSVSQFCEACYYSLFVILDIQSSFIVLSFI